MSKKKSKKKTGKKKASKKVAVESYRHESATRKNIPTAKIAAEGIVPRVAKAKYSYSAHLSPELRFDASGQSDRVSEIVEKAVAGKKLTNEEADILRGVAANASQPWLEWSGKKEEHDRRVLEVEPVALHIHERVSANAIIRAAKREDVQADLFADPKQEYREAIQFYKHDVDWANRLILGDSLEVMSSLARRESLAEKVQTIFIDPPYGINYRSNFQPVVGQRDVKNKDIDLPREIETIQAYRDTWTLGIHSYATYIRDRCIAAKELLSSSGSIFLQIGDENLHLVRQILDDVLGRENFCGLIVFTKTGGQAGSLLPSVCDYLVWYAKDKRLVKYNQLYRNKIAGEEGATGYTLIEDELGSWRSLSKNELSNIESFDQSAIFDGTPLMSDGASEAGSRPFECFGKTWSLPQNSHWKTSFEGLERLVRADRIIQIGNRIEYKRFLHDFGVTALSNIWLGLGERGFTGKKLYVVQTASQAIERCLLMTSDPGNIVLDPTCGSGTTAFAAEKWGRRWITMDTSRVSITSARQRLLTASYEFYKVSGSPSEPNTNGIDPESNFVYRTVPHIELRSIARNENLDPIFDRHDSLLSKALMVCNDELSGVDDQVRQALVNKLAEHLEANGLRAGGDLYNRRWLLPGTSQNHVRTAFSGKRRLKAKHISEYFEKVPSSDCWEHWNLPFDTDPSWPEGLRIAVTQYRKLWKEKLAAVNQCISDNAEQEELVDQPQVVDGVVRVSGPFTVEGVRPEELSLDEAGELFDPTPNQWEVNDVQGGYSQNASAYLDRMRQLLSQDGVTFPNNESRRFVQIEPLDESDSALHAEALWEGAEDGDLPSIAVAFGPQHGPVTASQVEDLIRASRRYDELVIAAFSFDGASQAVIQESANPRLKIHMAHIRPDVSPGMGGLLKDSPKSQLFTVFGQPEIKLHEEGGEIKVELLGVDIYSPLTGEITSSGANKVAAWFLDSDYDGRCFCITQAFFPNQKSWDKIARALGSSANAEAFQAYNGTVSIPFEPGEHQRIAVKVIDPRGNEVMAIRSLKDAD